MRVEGREEEEEGRRDGRTGRGGGRDEEEEEDQEEEESARRAMLRSKPGMRPFRALFQYLPLRDSPNDNPHLELALQAGQLVLVRGPMDEDRFYWGETLDGRSGLVPSNFVVRDDQLMKMLTGLDENNHHQRVRESQEEVKEMSGREDPSGSVCAAPSASVPRALPRPHPSSCPLRRPCSPSFVLPVPAHLAQISHNFTSTDHHPPHPPPRPSSTSSFPSSASGDPRQLPDSVCPYPPVDVSRVNVQELRTRDQPRVPFPRELQVEKRLSRSAVLSWLPPDCVPSTSASASVCQYQVCVNGAVKTVVPGSFKCRALVEDLELDRFANLSVRAVGVDGNASADAACTLAVGAEAPVAPQHVRVSHVSPVSAHLSWYPSNSNAEHVILLNALKVGVCPPAVFQILLNGLSPSTIYRLSVRTKHPRAVLEKRPVERCVDFKTLPKIGLPDPPSDVQVEPGPQPQTLLVSWRPSTSQPRPPSRASVHSYLIFADGRNIAQVPSSTADHVLLRLSDFADDPPIFITVRTRTREGVLSADSNVVRVPRGNDDERQRRDRNGARDEAGTRQPLLSCSLPSHILGTLVCSCSPSAAVPASTHHHCAQPPSSSSVSLPPSAHQGLLLPMPDILPPPLCSSSSSHPNHHPRQQQLLLTPSNGPLARGREGAQQYFTFHPRELHREFPRVEERPSMLEMEQSYLLRHQQRQRLRSGTPERRSLPPSLLGQQASSARTPAPVLPSTSATPPTKRVLAGQLARLRDEFQASGTRSEPDLRPSRMPGGGDSRWFVAVQNHQAATPDELGIRRHQLIKVYGTVDRNGFCWAEVRNRFGLVPAEKLVEIAKDDLFLAAEQKGLGHPSAATAEPQQPWTSRSAEGPGKRRMQWGSFKSRSYEHTRSGDGRFPPELFARSAEQQQAAGDRWHEGPVHADQHSARGWPPTSVRNSSYEPQQQERKERGNRERGRRMSAAEMMDRYPRRTENGATRERAQQWMRAEREEMSEENERTRVRRAEEAESEREQTEEEEEEGEERARARDQYQQQPQMSQHRERAPLQPLRGMPTHLMVAKYDYSRQFSPNVDAEQVELSFRQGDLITVYGPMDEDGFYLGELNGVRGLVPSNFLQPAPSAHPDQSDSASGPSAPTRPKGVAFSSDLMMTANHTGPPAPRRAMPAQMAEMGGQGGTVGAGSGTRMPATGAAGMTSKVFKVAGMATAGPGGKTLTKKSSDLSSSRKSSQTAMRGPGIGGGGGGRGGFGGAVTKRKA